jgi:uncharacterized protein YecE (DUF72 family)
MAKLKIGTCSWKYDSWRGIIYSQEPKINFLQEYSNFFDTVEIDQWFWSLYTIKKVSLPNPRTVEEYKSSIPEDFKFSIKIPNSITLTHFYKKSKDEPLVENPYFLSKNLFKEFLKSLAPIKDHLGPLMFQFEYLNKQKMNSQFDFQAQFASFIQSLPQEYEYAVEIRNPNYLNNNYFEFINENNLSHVFLQGNYMPSIIGVYKKHKELINNKSVIRLHGPDRKGIEKKSKGDWSKIIEPKDEELSNVVKIISEMLNKEIDIYLNVNNHYEGSAPLTIEKIKTILK